METKMEQLQRYIELIQAYIGLEYDLSEQDKLDISGMNGLIDEIIAPAYFEGEPVCNLAGILVANLRRMKAGFPSTFTDD